MKLRITGSTILLLEMKSKDEQFEEYNSDWLYLKVVNYQQGVDYMKLTTEEQSKHQHIVRIDARLESIYDLELKVAETFHIPLNKVVMLLKIQFGNAKNATVKTEVLNLNWRKSKPVQDGPRLENYTVIYVEEGDTKDKNEHFKWHQEFNKEFGKLTLLVNDPSLAAPTQADFKLEIQVNKSNTL